MLLHFSFCLSGTSWCPKRWRRMSFGETISTEWDLPSRALSWLLWHLSPPLPLPNHPTAPPRLTGRNLWTYIWSAAHYEITTGPWMMLRMELETKRTSSSQNSKRWSSSSLMSLIHFHSSLQKHFSIFRLPAKTCRKQMRQWKSLVLQRWVEKTSSYFELKIFHCWSKDQTSHLYQNDAEWEAELEGELNEYEMVNPKQRKILS